MLGRMGGTGTGKGANVQKQGKKAQGKKKGPSKVGDDASRKPPEHK